MANTNFIKQAIEPYVRRWLPNKFPRQSFQEKSVHLIWGGSHKFDAVSLDGSIVATVLSNRPRTRTGKENTGGVRKAITDVCRFHGVPSNLKKVMVFTDEGFRDLIRRRAKGLGIETIETVFCPLTEDMKRRLDKALDTASYEQRARK